VIRPVWHDWNADLADETRIGRGFFTRTKKYFFVLVISTAGRNLSENGRLVYTFGSPFVLCEINQLLSAELVAFQKLLALFHTI